MIAFVHPVHRQLKQRSPFLTQINESFSSQENLSMGSNSANNRRILPGKKSQNCQALFNLLQKTATTVHQNQNQMMTVCHLSPEHLAGILEYAWG